MGDNLNKHIFVYGGGPLFRTEMVTSNIDFLIMNVVILCVDYTMSNGLCVNFDNAA